MEHLSGNKGPVLWGRILVPLTLNQNQMADVRTLFEQPREDFSFAKFEKFAENRGWVLGKDDVLRERQRQEWKKSQILQAWLFFGLIAFVVRENDALLTFVDLVHQSTHTSQYVTTSELPGKLQQWHDCLKKKKDKAKLHEYLIDADRALEIARRVVRANFVAEHANLGTDESLGTHEGDSSGASVMQTNHDDTSVYQSDRGLGDNRILELCLMVLGETLSAVKTHIMKDLGLTTNGWFMDDDEGWGPPSYVLAKMKDAKWCRRVRRVLRGQLGSSAILLYAAYANREEENSTDKSTDDQHADCTEDDCFLVQGRKAVSANMNQKGVYETQHHKSLCLEDKLFAGERLKCKQLGPNMKEVYRILRSTDWTAEAHEFPLFRIVSEVIRHPDGKPVVGLVKGVTVEKWGRQENRSLRSPDFAAISHVWSQGMGNETANKLHECQLKFIRTVLADLDAKIDNKYAENTDFIKSLVSATFNNRNRTPPSRYQLSAPFWMDTLAIPVGGEVGNVDPPLAKFRELKQTAIRQIYHVFNSATRVIVIDKELYENKAGLEIAQSVIKVLTSPWMRRMWTLQEAFLSQHLSIAFERNEDEYVLEDLDSQLSKLEGVNDGTASMAFHLSMAELSKRKFYHNMMGEDREIRNRKDHPIETRGSMVIASAWRSSRWRNTSRLEDETLALSTLLNLDYRGTLIERASEIAKLHDSDRKSLREEMMQDFWTLVHRTYEGSIPAGLIFLPGERLSKAGFGWAPRTWMSGKDESYPYPLTLVGKPTELRQEGLLVQYPGFLLHGGDPSLVLATVHTTRELKFPINRHLTEWYKATVIDEADPSLAADKIRHRVDLNIPPDHGDTVPDEEEEALDGDDKAPGQRNKPPDFGIILSRPKPGEWPEEIGLLVEVYRELWRRKEPERVNKKIYCCQIIHRVLVCRIAKPDINQKGFPIPSGKKNQEPIGEVIPEDTMWCVDGYQDIETRKALQRPSKHGSAATEGDSTWQTRKIQSEAGPPNSKGTKKKDEDTNLHSFDAVAQNDVHSNQLRRSSSSPIQSHVALAGTAPAAMVGAVATASSRHGRRASSPVSNVRFDLDKENERRHERDERRRQRDELELEPLERLDRVAKEQEHKEQERGARKLREAECRAGKQEEECRGEDSSIASGAIGAAVGGAAVGAVSASIAGNKGKGKQKEREPEPPPVVVESKPTSALEAHPATIDTFDEETPRPVDSWKSRKSKSPKPSKKDDRTEPEQYDVKAPAVDDYEDRKSKRRSERSKKVHTKKWKGFFNFGNGSSSSSNSELAFGYGYVRKRKSKKRQDSDEDLKATLAGLTTTAAAISVAQGRSKHSKSKSELVAVWESKGKGKGKHQIYLPDHSSHSYSDEEDRWESAEEDDASESSGIISGLAFGDFNFSDKRKSQESLLSESSGTSKWGWRWGTKKKKKAPSLTANSGSLVGPNVAGMAGATVIGNSLGRNESTMSSSVSSIPALQSVYAMPTPGDLNSYNAVRHTESTSSQSQSTQITRPENISIQHPQPKQTVPGTLYTLKQPIQLSYVAPNGPSVFANTSPQIPFQPASFQPGLVESLEQGFSSSFEERPPRIPPRRGNSSPTLSSMRRDTAIGVAAGVAAGTIAASMSSRHQRRQSSPMSNVRFDLTEQQSQDQAKRKDRERQKAQARKDEEIRRRERQQREDEEARWKEIESHSPEVEPVVIEPDEDVRHCGAFYQSPFFETVSDLASERPTRGGFIEGEIVNKPEPIKKDIMRSTFNELPPDSGTIDDLEEPKTPKTPKETFFSGGVALEGVGQTKADESTVQAAESSDDPATPHSVSGNTSPNLSPNDAVDLEKIENLAEEARFNLNWCDFDRAELQYKDCLKNFGDSKEPLEVYTRVFMQKALVKFQRGEYKEAQKELERLRVETNVISLPGRQDEITYHLSRVLVRRGKYQKASGMLQTLQKGMPFQKIREHLQGHNSPPESELDNLTPEVEVVLGTTRLLALLEGYYGRYEEAERRLVMAAKWCHNIEAQLAEKAQKDSRKSTNDASQEKPRQSHIDVKTVRAQIDLARAEVLMMQGQSRERRALALDIARSTFRSLESQFGAGDILTLEAAAVHAVILSSMFDRQAAAVCTATINTLSKHLGREHPLAMEVLNALVGIFVTQDRPYEAHDTISALMTQALSRLGKRHPQTLRYQCQLGEVDFNIGNYRAAREELQDAYETARNTWHGQKLGAQPGVLRCLTKLAMANYCMQKLDLASKQIKEALQGQVAIFIYPSKETDDIADLFKRLKGDFGFAPAANFAVTPHPDVLESLAVYAALHAMIDREQAHPVRKATLEILELVYEKRKRCYGDTHPVTLRSGIDLGYVYLESELHDRNPNFEEFHGLLCRQCDEFLGPNHTITWMAKMAYTLTKYVDGELTKSNGGLTKSKYFDGESTKIKSELAVIVKGLTAQLGQSHPVALDSMARLLAIQLVNNDQAADDTALQLLGQLRRGKIREQRLIPSLELEWKFAVRYCHANRYEQGLQILDRLKNYLNKASDLAKASDLEEEFKKFREKFEESSQGFRRLAKGLLNTMLVEGNQKQADGAESAIRRAVALSRALHGEDGLETVKALFSLVKILNRMDDTQKCIEGLNIFSDLVDTIKREKAESDYPQLSAAGEEPQESRVPVKAVQERVRDDSHCEDKNERDKLYKEVLKVYKEAFHGVV